jgi:hypothetical protein
MKHKKEIAPNLQSEEEEAAAAEEIFKNAEIDVLANEELKVIQEEFQVFLKEYKEKIAERLGSYQIDPQEAEGIVKNIERGLAEQLRMIAGNFNNFKQLVIEALPRIKASSEITDEQKIVTDWIAVASRLAITKIISRKIKGELTDQDEMVLGLMGGLVDGGTMGHHDQLSGEINLRIFNKSTLEDYKKIIDHELTHYCFRALFPDYAQLRLIGVKETLKDPELAQYSTRLPFSNLLLAINESAAHLIGDQTPDFKGYSKHMLPEELFTEIFNALKERVKDLDKSEYDKTLSGIYLAVAEKWSDDLELKDIEEIVEAVKSNKI